MIGIRHIGVVVSDMERALRFYRDFLGLAVTASIGVAVADHRDATPDDLVKRADEALYEAKNNGRNQVIAALG